MVTVQPAGDAVHLAAVHTVIQKQLHEQKQRQVQQQQPAMMIPSDRYRINTDHSLTYTDGTV